MALASAGIECELREVKLAAKPASMLEISKKGTVPVLQLQDGKVMDESLDLMHWALAQNDPEAWLEVDLQASNLLIQENDESFKPQLDKYKYFVRYPGKSQEFYRQEAEGFLGKIESKLESHLGRGLVCERTSLADIAIFPFVRQFSRVDFDWFRESSYQAIVAWLANIESLALFQGVMKKYEPWKQERGNSYLFP